MGRTLALVGGGHAHVEVLRQLAEHPNSDLDVALFDPSPSVWYSGMVPGVIAGHYKPAEAKVNLWALCQRARVRFFETAVTRIDAAKQRIYTAQGERHFYDMLSLNVGGATRTLPITEGAFVVPVKPIGGLVDMVEERSQLTASQVKMAVIGGGAAAVEVALALAHRWRGRNCQLSIVASGQLLAQFPAFARRRALQSCADYRIKVIESRRVIRLDPGRLCLDGGETVVCHVAILATGHAAPELLRSSGLELAPDGTAATNASLQSINRPNVFAVGDCASVVSARHPKAGVTSVRQGRVLLSCLNAYARGERLPTWRSSTEALALITLGDRQAIAARNGFAIAGAWVWRWKDAIDRRWIKRYTV
ncbi:MAG: FAD-dependent oxidoreductase [Casimicrobiaceae bacterium]